MNGARIGIAAQSIGIGEAAYRIARDYGNSRKQFGVTIDTFPAVRELLVNMQVDLQAARSLTYFATYSVDHEICALKKQAYGEFADKAEKKEVRLAAKKYGRYNKVLTPMSKYYASEMSMRVSNDGVAVLGGSGYMKDYASERLLRDSRITTIYEGTSQLQVLAAVAGVVSGTCATIIEELLEKPYFGGEWTEETKPLIEQLRQATTELEEAIVFVKAKPSQYKDLYARKLVDMAINIIVGILFCDQATSELEMGKTKLSIAKHWLNWRLPENKMFKEKILSGVDDVTTDFETLAGPVPVLA